MKKIFRILMLLFVMIPSTLIFAACGGNPDNNDGNDNNNSGGGNSWIQYFDYKLDFMVDDTVYYTVDKIPKNTNVEIPTNPTKEGYIFAGWEICSPYGDSMEDLTDYINDTNSYYFIDRYGEWSSVELSCDQIAYAKWVVDDGTYIKSVNSTVYEDKNFTLRFDIITNNDMYNDIAGILNNDYTRLKRSVTSVDLTEVINIDENSSLEVYKVDNFYEGDYQDGELVDASNIIIDPLVDYTCYYAVVKNQNHESKVYELTLHRNSIYNYKFYNMDEIMSEYEQEEDEPIIVPTQTPSNGLSGYTFQGWTTTPASNEIYNFQYQNNQYISDTFYAVYTNNNENKDSFYADFNYEKNEVSLTINMFANLPTNFTVPEFFFTHKVTSFNANSNNSLINVTVPSSIPPSEYMFNYCENLKNVTFLGSYKKLPEYIFSDCTNLESVTSSSELTEIGEYAFNNCSSLNSFSLSNKIESIGDYAFYSCSSLNNLTYASTLASIGKFAFDGCASFSSVILPKTMTSIGEKAFNNCTNITNVYLPDNININDIRHLLYGCINVQTISVNMSDGSKLHVLFSKNLSDNDTKMPTTITKVIAIGDEVSGALASSTDKSVEINVTEIVISNSVKKLYSRFDGWNKLQKVTFEDGIELDYALTINTKYVSLDNFPTSVKEISNLILTDDITEVPFDKMPNITKLPGIESNTITEIIIPTNSKINEIIGLAGIKNLTKVVLPNNLKDNTVTGFINCSKLEEVTIPASATIIGKHAFSNCKRLKTINLVEDNITHISEYAFENASFPLVGFFKKVVSIADYAFSYSYLKANDNDGNFAFPSSLKSIGQYAFQAASISAKKFEFPASIESIGYRAFNYQPPVNGHPSFTTHNIDYFVFNSFLKDPAGAEHVYFLTGNKGNIYKNINSMPDYAFTGVTIKGSMDFSDCTFESFGDYAFSEVQFINYKFTFPTTMKSLGDYAFKNSTFIADDGGVWHYEPFIMPESITVYDNSFGGTDYNNCFGALEGTNFWELTLPYVSELSVFNLYGSKTVPTSNSYVTAKDYITAYSLTVLGKNKSNLNFSFSNDYTTIDLSNADYDEISGGLFKKCTSLNSLTLPKDLCVTNELTFEENVGLGTATRSFLSKCTNLTQLTINSYDDAESLGIGDLPKTLHLHITNMETINLGTLGENSYVYVYFTSVTKSILFTSDTQKIMLLYDGTLEEYNSIYSNNPIITNNQEKYDKSFSMH